ncbi:hypothetical protein GLOTRDRAFT_102095 [Gloeophyllum trabeum ATCC 11539]|uniref:DH domain-containing protein n=1 Tax=Gloeophyllum trabeum (strain ATCC 11539 / FP-39264 / Madison 617) TaxID=670483 RepID=S7S373_GLOTA|nr:uncharacterized protein GLOTRDRAFT_102095 [Gloeophyllum trabeum ATCC 11539]EPQ60289.1 hypothetical protein GLOTRDRAFT_102095 [Gloeophyllum trabeum ATCC 11539]
MVYGAQDEEDEEHEDDDEDEVWGDGREEWLEIKKAKMCCRELVRTERNYLRCLRDLIDGETQTPPSPLLLAYLPALLAASNSFLAHLVSDPTPYGVSAAFLGCEDEMEAAFVAWCGIVGCVFADGTPSSRGRKAAKEGLSVGQRAKSGFFGKGLPSGEGRPSARSVSYVGTVDITGTGMFTAALGSGLKFPLAPLNVNAVAVAPKKSASSWRKSMPALGNFVVTPSNGSSSNSGASTIRLVGKRKHQKSGSTFFFASVENDGDDDSGKEKEKRKKRPTVRDLAIQPVQRVMRYVLQYKDLLNHTPASSPARALVERALEGATRIAAKCDRAQDNAAFLR